MTENIKSHIKFEGLPELMLRELKAARLKRGWSQAELGQRVGLPQMHISGIETGKIVPRFDTLLDLVRVLEFDLLMIPRSLVPAVQSLVRDQQHEHEERSLYADNDDEENQEGSPHNEV